MLPDNLLSWTKALVKKYHLKPGQRLGQHFLIDKSVIQTILDTAELKPGQPVLEVGGGLGTLTLFLLAAGVNLTVVELDSQLKSVLDEYKKTSPNLKVILADILKISDQSVKDSLQLTSDQPWFLLANLPYEITGAFLRRWLSGNFKPNLMVLLLQREVAERLVAPPGQLSLLGLQAQLNAQVKLVKKVKRGAFLPPPKVESSVVSLSIYSQDQKNELLDGLSEDFFWQVAHIGFSTKRKQLLNSLSRGLEMDRGLLTEIILSLGLKITSRPQELSVKDWIRLCKKLIKCDLNFKK
ncbi:MAG: 16S rRNA (adenine(1518)-N(6)/adenine(1519)-N(6))-dimethyltransferase RsmA [Patescibacteria group bacterium]